MENWLKSNTLYESCHAALVDELKCEEPEQLFDMNQQVPATTLFT